MKDLFRKFSVVASNATGSPIAFILAIILIIGWLAVGPLFDWSDSHSLFVNTVTTCITYLLVFIIQSSQNRDTKALHLKLDELIRANEQARNSLIDLEDSKEEEVQAVVEEFKREKNL